MTTTTTNTITPVTHERPARRRRLLRVGAAAGAALAVTAIGIVVTTDGTERPERPAQLWDQKRAAALAEVAEWARTHHMTGLSPASLTPIAQGPGAEPSPGAIKTP